VGCSPLLRARCVALAAFNARVGPWHNASPAAGSIAAPKRRALPAQICHPRGTVRCALMRTSPPTSASSLRAACASLSETMMTLATVPSATCTPTTAASSYHFTPSAQRVCKRGPLRRVGNFAVPCAGLVICNKTRQGRMPCLPFPPSFCLLVPLRSSHRALLPPTTQECTAASQSRANGSPVWRAAAPGRRD
jgi:hypothetical protein